MAIAKVQKIQLIGIEKHKIKILEALQNVGALEIREINTEEDPKEDLQKNPKHIHSLQKAELNLANIDFSIKFLSNYTKKPGLFADPITLSTKQVQEKAKEIDYRKIVEQCKTHNEAILKAKNEINIIENELTVYTPWENLNIHLENIKGTVKTSVILGAIKSKIYEEAYHKLNTITPLLSVEIIKHDENNTYISIVFDKKHEKEIRQTLSEYKFTEAELPNKEGLLKKYLENLEEEKAEKRKIIKENESFLNGLTHHLEELKIVHDYLVWEKEKLEEEQKITNTDYSFVIHGWMLEEKRKTLEKNLGEITKEFVIDEIEPEENEAPPVMLKNYKYMEPFEAITSIYGLPLYSEIDPTPFLAAYFIIFFGMCLTDAGYGLIMFVLMYLALKKLKLGGGVKKLVRLLMYGGIITFIIGTVFGGWFGFTPDQVPKIFTYETAGGEKLFIFQKLNSLTNPLTVLIIALSIGFIQILMGTYMKFIHAYRHSNKKEALYDHGTWAFMLTGIGFTVLTASGVISSSFTEFGKWWIILATIFLILTQGHDKKSIFGKLMSGILSLYGLIGYLSDVLSYSRLLALGLATTIIGLAVNIIADLLRDMIPVIGWILMIIVFIGGHIFNLIINALGAFIHSGRLQFVEFFGKFLEGGGTGFKPFSKKSKYVFIKNH